MDYTRNVQQLGSHLCSHIWDLNRTKYCIGLMYTTHSTRVAFPLEMLKSRWTAWEKHQFTWVSFVVLKKGLSIWSCVGGFAVDNVWFSSVTINLSTEYYLLSYYLCTALRLRIINSVRGKPCKWGLLNNEKKATFHWESSKNSWGLKVQNERLEERQAWGGLNKDILGTLEICG